MLLPVIDFGPQLAAHPTRPGTQRPLTGQTDKNAARGLDGAARDVRDLTATNSCHCSGKQRAQGVQIHRLDQVVIEAGRARVRGQASDEAVVLEMIMVFSPLYFLQSLF